MSNCALVGAVEFNEEHFKKQSFDYIIAVDGGYKHLQNIGVKPDVVLGDFDSLGYVPEGLEVIEFPEEKDESDIELAMEHAVDGGFHTLIVYGCLGGRIDHTYGVSQLIGGFTQRGNQVFVVGEDTIVTALIGGGLDTLNFSDRAKGTLSVFAFDEVVKGVDEIGLKYPLDKATLTHDKPLGVSNTFTHRPATVSVQEGTLLIFFPLQVWNCLLLK